MRFFYKILHRIFPSLVFFVENTENIYITIDDSPSEKTIEILDILDIYNVKATFFCIGANIEKFPTEFNEILNRKHNIGYHSYSHQNAWKWKNKSYDFKADFDSNQLQFKSNIYRPPYGKLTWPMYKYISMTCKIILYDILTEDWKSTIDPIKKIDKKIKKILPGSIIVFHDSAKSIANTRIMLPIFLEHCKTNNLTQITR